MLCHSRSHLSAHEFYNTNDASECRGGYSFRFARRSKCNRERHIVDLTVSVGWVTSSTGRERTLNDIIYGKETAGPVVYCMLSYLISSHLGFVHPLQDVALHQCLPSSSVCCLPNPGGSLLLCYVILPSSAWSSSGPLPSSWLPLCASPCPPIVL